MTKPLLVMAAGGTGGHMFPAQALAEHMLREGWRVRLTTDARGARYTGGFPHSVEIVEIPSATFARGGLIGKARAPFTIARGVGAAWRSFLRDKPAVVAGFGGYPSIPALAAARMLRIPALIHEQNGVTGRVNSFFAKKSRVAALACGTWPTDAPKSVPHVFTGNPVRRAILEKAGAPYIPPGDHPMEILVIGGSQGARILSDIVPPSIAELPMQTLRNLRVSHQARPEDVDRVAHFYADHAIRAEVQPFFHDIPRRMSEAQLVIARSGASTVADLSVIGRPSILVPFAAATADHQTANAKQLVKADAAVLIPEKRLDVPTLSDHIAAILADPDAAAQMARAALDAGRPDATERLAALVTDLAEGRMPNDAG